MKLPPEPVAPSWLERLAGNRSVVAVLALALIVSALFNAFFLAHELQTNREILSRIRSGQEAAARRSQDLVDAIARRIAEQHGSADGPSVVIVADDGEPTTIIVADDREADRRRRDGGRREPEPEPEPEPSPDPDPSPCLPVLGCP